MTKEEAKKMFTQSNRVIMTHLRVSDKSKCQKKGCKKDDKYTLFVGSDTRLSTMFASCCDKHLSDFTDKAIAEAKRNRKGQFIQWCKQQKKEARKLIES